MTANYEIHNPSSTAIQPTIRMRPESCLLAPPDRSPAHDFAVLPESDVYRLFCRQCGEKRP